MLFNILRLKLILLIILINPLLDADNYNEDIINIYSKMLPRFVMMSSQKTKIKNDLTICILHDHIDNRVAQQLKAKIEENYPDGLLDHSIELIQSDYDHLDACKSAQLMFMFNSNEKRIENTLLFSKENALLTVAYTLSLLDKGADISLFIGRKVTPYLNMNSITDKKILLDNILLRVSKIYTKGER